MAELLENTHHYFCGVGRERREQKRGKHEKMGSGHLAFPDPACAPGLSPELRVQDISPHAEA